MDATANTPATQGHAADHLPTQGPVTEAEPPTEAVRAIREPTVDEVRQEWQGYVATLRDQLKAANDHRIMRLREIAIDTAIRNSGASKIGGCATAASIVEDAKVYFSFLDNGGVLPGPQS